MKYNKCPICIHAGNKCQHVIANTIETLFYLKNMIQYDCNVEINLNCKDFKPQNNEEYAGDKARYYPKYCPECGRKLE